MAIFRNTGGEGKKGEEGAIFWKPMSRMGYKKKNNKNPHPNPPPPPTKKNPQKRLTFGKDGASL